MEGRTGMSAPAVNGDSIPYPDQKEIEKTTPHRFYMRFFRLKKLLHPSPTY